MKHTLETFLNKYKYRLSNNIEVIGTYIGFSNPITCRCKICGQEYKTTPQSLIKGCGHKSCSSKKACNTVRLSLDIVKERISKINPTIKIIDGTYENQNSKLKCECLTCGNIWDSMAYDLLQGKGCYYCGIKKRAKSKTFTHEEFVKKMNNINNSIEILSKYTKARNKVHCKCKICGNE